MDANDRSHRSQKTSNHHHRPLDFKVRCRCDTVNDKGEMIECKECEQWQHTYCMGIVNTQNTKDYRCEICQPRLLMVTKSDATRYQRGPEPNSQSSAAPKIRRSRTDYPLDTEHLLNYIAEKCQLIHRPVVVTKFFNDYKQVAGYEGHVSNIITRCRALLLKNTVIMKKFRMDIRAKMFFITSSPVDAAFLKELRKSAQVIVDVGNRITSYKSPSASFSGKPTRSGYFDNKHRGTARRSQDSSDEEEQEEDPMDGNDHRYLDEEEDNLEILFDNRVTPGVKVEPAYSIANSYENSTELIQNQSFSNFASPPLLPNFRIPVTPRHVAQYPNYMPHAHHHHQMRMMENHALNRMNNLMQSFTGLCDSQVQLMRELVNQRVQTPPPPPPPPQEEHTSLRHFLDYFRMYIHRLESAQLTSLNQEIVAKSREDGVAHKTIPLSRLQLALESAVALADSSTESFTFELTDAVEFFRIIRIYAVGQRGTQLHKFCEMLKNKLRGMDNRQKIHVERIKVALEAAVGIVMSQ